MRLPILIFTGLFLFEPFYFVLSSSDLPVPDLPLGVLFGLATFALSYRYIKQPHYTLPLLLIFFCMVAVYISARRSEWFDYEWVVLFAWYISKFILGYALARCLARVGWRSDALVASTVIFSAGIWAVMSFGETVRFNYLRPSSSLLCAGVVALFCAKKRTHQVAVYAFVAAALLSLTSRTYTYLWLISPSVFWAAGHVLSGRPMRRIVVASASCGAIAVVAISAVGVLSILPSELVPDRLTPRVELTGGGLSVADNSINLRVLSFQQGWEQIKENVVTGYYNGYLEYGGHGNYIHGALSYWHQYGLVPFAFLCMGVVYIFSKTFFSSERRSALITASVFGLSSIAAIFSQAYTNSNLFWAIGFSMAALSLRPRIARSKS